MTLAELKAYLAELDETRKAAQKELSALRDHEECVRDLERDRDAVLDSLEAQAPEALDSPALDERQQWYRLLGLRAEVRADGAVEVSWAGAPATPVCEATTLSRPTAR